MKQLKPWLRKRAAAIRKTGCRVAAIDKAGCRVAAIDKARCRVAAIDKTGCRVAAIDKAGCRVAAIDKTGCRVAAGTGQIGTALYVISTFGRKLPEKSYISPPRVCKMRFIPNKTVPKFK
ncbi:MAG: hypothetical protein HGA22_03070 [Clostridiales bacterium]|nr:hypothetical protein [Clostridiales bacterium]